MNTTGDIPVKVEISRNPDDVKPQWLNVIRALQAACSRNRGWATVAVKVLVDRDNMPVLWSEPKLEKIHPKTPAMDILLDLTNAG